MIKRGISHADMIGIISKYKDDPSIGSRVRKFLAQRPRRILTDVKG